MLEKKQKSLKEVMLEAPETQLDPKAKELIRKWSDDPTALEVLETIDMLIHGSMGSGFSVMALQFFYSHLLKEENTTHEELVKRATWRKES